LASLSIRAISHLVILFTRFGLIFRVKGNFPLQFSSSVSKRTVISELTSASKFPILAQLCLIFPSVLFYKHFSFLLCGKFLSFRTNVYFEIAISVLVSVKYWYVIVIFVSAVRSTVIIIVTSIIHLIITPSLLMIRSRRSGSAKWLYSGHFISWRLPCFIHSVEFVVVMLMKHVR